MKNRRNFIKQMAIIGILTALSFVFGMIKIPVSGTSVTLMLPVVVIGAALCGPLVGAWLTVIPSLVTLLVGEAALFMAVSPVATVVTLFLKGILAGLAAGLVYKALSNKRPYGAVVLSAVVAPVVNTGIFLLGCYLFLWDAIMSLATDAGVGVGAVLIGLAGINFVVELVLNVVLCPAILRIIRVASKKRV